MQFYNPKTGNDAQIQPLVPNKIISGNLPGHTQIRIGGDKNVIIDGINSRFSVGDGSNTRVVMGKISATTYGLKVSQLGFDADTATDSQLIFSTDYNMFKIVKVLRKTQVVTGGVGVIGGTFPHGLDHTPAWLAYASSTETSGQLFFATVAPSSTSSDTPAYVNKIDATNVYVTFTDSGLTRTVNITVYLMQETAN